jgi:hypothetical protein
MTKAEKTQSVWNMVAGWICLATASLSAWNMVGVGVTWPRLLLVGILTPIGLFLLIRYYRARPQKS